MDQKIIPNRVVAIIVRYKTHLLLFFRFKNSNELVNWYEIVKIGKSVNLLGHVRIAYIFHVFQNPKFKMLSGIYSIVGIVPRKYYFDQGPELVLFLASIQNNMAL